MHLELVCNFHKMLFFIPLDYRTISLCGCAPRFLNLQWIFLLTRTNIDCRVIWLVFVKSGIKKKGPKIFLLDKIRDNFFETLDRQKKETNLWWQQIDHSKHLWLNNLATYWPSKLKSLKWSLDALCNTSEWNLQ